MRRLGRGRTTIRAWSPSVSDCANATASAGSSCAAPTRSSGRRRCSTATASSPSCDAVPSEQLDRLRAAAADAILTLVDADPEASVGGGAGGLPHRYSFGGTSATRQMFHRPEWCELIDMPTTTPILTAIFGSPELHRLWQRWRPGAARRDRVPGSALRQHVVGAARPGRRCHDARPTGAGRST